MVRLDCFTVAVCNREADKAEMLDSLSARCQYPWSRVSSKQGGEGGGIGGGGGGGGGGRGGKRGGEEDGDIYGDIRRDELEWHCPMLSFYASECFSARHGPPLNDLWRDNFVNPPVGKNRQGVSTTTTMATTLLSS
uniref:Uncharacterized protein n=1 Tax=Vespula pensylvanica TaxID=30213 RepID=A0A834PBN2_VESPE|nr:hypothetical protein H0235_003555 [Vespula pensylvanica]